MHDMTEVIAAHRLNDNFKLARLGGGGDLHAQLGIAAIEVTDLHAIDENDAQIADIGLKFAA